MKNIVFDLGGVVFHRDAKKVRKELIDFFAFIFAAKMPLFWEEYDRGTLTFDEVLDELSRSKGCDRAVAEDYLREALDRQEAVPQTAALIRDLKRAGYRLYVLSNMSREFIDFLRRTEIYGCFDGEVVSCEEGVVKPEPRIYEILLDRFGLDPAETLFIAARISKPPRHSVLRRSISVSRSRVARSCAKCCCRRSNHLPYNTLKHEQDGIF
jgi:HAD superfamily hydrolase (TIGR01509 family)